MILLKRKLKELTKEERIIIEFIAKANKINPISLSDLADVTHISKRQIKEAVRRMREHFPIISSTDTHCNGYYIATNDNDIIDFVNIQTHYIKTLQKTVKAMKSHLKNE